jgi:hypothetical protein
MNPRVLYRTVCPWSSGPFAVPAVAIRTAGWSAAPQLIGGRLHTKQNWFLISVVSVWCICGAAARAAGPPGDMGEGVGWGGGGGVVSVLGGVRGGGVGPR